MSRETNPAPLSWRARLRWQVRRLARATAWLVVGTCVCGSLLWLGWLLVATHARTAALAAAAADGVATDFHALLQPLVPDERNAALLLERANLLMIQPTSRPDDGRYLPAAQALLDLVRASEAPTMRLSGVTADDHPRAEEKTLLPLRILALGSGQRDTLLAGVTQSPWWPLLIQAADLPECRFVHDQDDANPLAIRLPHLSWLRSELKVVRRTALLHAAGGDHANAWRLLRLAERLAALCLRGSTCYTEAFTFSSEQVANRELILDLCQLGGEAAREPLAAYLATGLPAIATRDDWQRIVGCDIALWTSGLMALETQRGDSYAIYRSLIEPWPGGRLDPLSLGLSIHPLIGRPFLRQETAALIQALLALRATAPADLPLDSPKDAAGHAPGLTRMAELTAVSYAQLRQQTLFADLALACVRHHQVHGEWPATPEAIDARFRPTDLPRCEFLRGPTGLRLKREGISRLSQQIIRLYDQLPHTAPPTAPAQPSAL